MKATLAEEPPLHHPPLDPWLDAFRSRKTARPAVQPKEPLFLFKLYGVHMSVATVKRAWT